MQPQENNSIENREILKQIGECNTTILGNFIDIEQDYAYITTMNGMDIINISNPRSPVKTGSIDLGSAFEIEVHGDFAYIQSGAINIVDLSNPGNYRINGRYDTGTRYSALEGRDNYLFAACVNNGMEILDISDPLQLSEYGKFEDTGNYIHIGMKEDVVFLGDSQEGIEVIDISDLRSPRKIRTIPGTEENYDLEVLGDLLIVGKRNDLLIYDISDPEVPIKISNVSGYANPRKMTAKGNFLFFHEGDEIVVAVDISNPATPEILGSIDEVTHDLFFDGTSLFSVSISPQKRLRIFKLNQ